MAAFGTLCAKCFKCGAVEFAYTGTNQNYIRVRCKDRDFETLLLSYRRDEDLREREPPLRQSERVAGPVRRPLAGPARGFCP